VGGGYRGQRLHVDTSEWRGAPEELRARIAAEAAAMLEKVSFCRNAAQIGRDAV